MGNGYTVAKKLKKADIDGVDGEATVEAPPEGGLSGWAVCGGSAVITSATAVVRTTVHVSVDSINTAFNVTKAGNKTTGNVTTPAPVPATTARNIDYNGCLNYLLANFPGSDDPGFINCVNLGVPTYHPCMENYFQGVDPATVPPVMQEICQFNLNQPQPLTAGNVFSATVTTDDEVVLLGAMLAVFLGYRITSVIGSVLVAAGFIVASFLDEEVAVTVLSAGVGGIGTALLRVAAIIAVLEYFDELRMRAIVLSGMGAVLINFLMIGITFIDGIDLNWTKTFKFQAIPAGISLVASFALKPLKLKSRRDRRGNQISGCGAKCSDYIFSGDLFTDIVFYLVVLVFLLDQTGRPIFSEGMQPIMEEKGFSQIKVDIQPFIENGGALLGLLLLLCWKRHDLPGNLAVLAAMDALIGILSLHVPEMTSYAWAAAYSAIFGFTDGVFASVLQDAIPEGFERRHIRIVAGILGFIGGVGTIASNWIAEALDDKFEGKHVPFYFSGACLLVAAVLALISRIVVVRRLDREQEEEETAPVEMAMEYGSRRY
ncbi:uncharacterized protein LOC128230638 [Mya arenaria]|uniref:uncharacterized protein LOC128230638 n=1 Tax=Mya arenaria TaxID=6604 RepID=UPI0022E42F70|nr:uncharacterized protein LOC128230638 [Mya arenaria]